MEKWLRELLVRLKAKMIIKAEQRYIRISPRKVRLVVDAIRKLKPDQALEQLSFMRKVAAVPVAKTIKQAMANAVKNLNIPGDSLIFDSIQIGEGPTFKRWRAVSRGRAHSIYKRTSHIKVLLKTQESKKPQSGSQETKPAKTRKKVTRMSVKPDKKEKKSTKKATKK